MFTRTEVKQNDGSDVFAVQVLVPHARQGAIKAARERKGGGSLSGVS